MAMIDVEAVDPRARGLRTPRAEDAAALGDRLRRLDWVLMAALAALLAYCLWAIDGITATNPAGSQTSRQITYAVGGFVLFLAALAIDPDVYRRHKRTLYFGTLALMGFVLMAGGGGRGGRGARGRRPLRASAAG